MNTTRLLSPFALSLLALAPAGCGHRDTIVGKWQGTVTQPRGTMNTTFEFTPDGKEIIGIQGNMGAMPITMGGAGAYTVSDTTLTQTLTTLTFGGRSMPVPTAQAKPQSNTFTLDGDHLTLTNPGSRQSLTLTRMKE